MMILTLSQELILVLTSLLINLLVLSLVVVIFVLQKRSLVQTKQDRLIDSRLKKKIAAKVEEKLGDKIEKAVESATTNFDKQFRSKLLSAFDNSLHTAKDLASFSQEQQKAIASQSQFLVAQAVDRVEKELEEYKKNQLERIDQQIHQIIFAASREIIGRTISLSEHEGLVNQALERAKKDHFF